MKIRLDSNILREPQRLEGMGNLAAGFARDIMIYAAWNEARLLVLHLPEFCAMFGYQRKHLLRPLDEKKLARLSKAVDKKDVPLLNSSLGWTLLCMAKYNLVFYTNAPGRIPETASKKTKTCRYESLQILSGLDPETCIHKLKTGTMATMEFSERFIYNCRGDHYQVLDLEDYLSLRTPAGKPDDAARRLYMHMTWRRQLWDGIAIPKGYDPRHPDYSELLNVAGLNFADTRKNAALLRVLLNRVCQLPTVRMTATVDHNAPRNSYDVTLSKQGDRIRPKRPRRQRKPAATA